MTERFMKVWGSRFTGVLVYVGKEELDPLARFIYDAVSRGLVERGDQLVEGLGLPGRLVEITVGDLVRGNYINVNPATGVLTCVAEGLRAERLKLEKVAMGFWQDHLTGGIVPFSEVKDRYDEPSEGAEVIDLPPIEPRADVSFLMAPDARVVSLITAGDPELSLRNGDEMVLDRVADRRLKGQQALYVPVSQIAQQEALIDYVLAPGIPSWMSRSWSRALRVGMDDGLMVDAEARELIHSVLGRFSIATLGRQWAARSSRLVHALPPPRSVHDVAELRRVEQQLRARWEDVGPVSVGPVTPSHGSHLHAAVAASEHALILGIRHLTRKTRDRLGDWLQQADLGGRDLLVLIGDPDVREDVVDRLRESASAIDGVEIRQVARRSLPCDLVLTDTDQLWLGPATALLGRRIVLHVLESRAVRSVRGVVAVVLDDLAGDAGDARRVKRRFTPTTDQRRRDPADIAVAGTTVDALMDRLGELAGRVEALTTAPELKEDEALSEVKGDGRKLSEDCRELATLLLVGPPRGRAVLAMQEGLELDLWWSAVVAQAEANPGKVGRIAVLLPPVEADTLSLRRDALDALSRLLRQNVQVELVCSATPTGQEAKFPMLLEASLAEFSGLAAVRVTRCTQVIPWAAMLVGDDVAVVSSRDFLLESDDTDGLGIGLGGTGIGEEFREAFHLL